MSTRVKRVEESMIHALRELLLFEVGDPRLTGVFITAVNMTSDLRLAHVNYILEDTAQPTHDRDPKREIEAMKGLKKVSPYLRRKLAEKILLKYSPDIQFHYDEGYEKGLHIERLLHEIETEE